MKSGSCRSIWKSSSSAKVKRELKAEGSICYPILRTCAATCCWNLWVWRLNSGRKRIVELTEVSIPLEWRHVQYQTPHPWVADDTEDVSEKTARLVSCSSWQELEILLGTVMCLCVLVTSIKHWNKTHLLCSVSLVHCKLLHFL